MHFFMPSGDLSSRWKGSTVKLRGDALLFATFTLTYHDKGPVAKVVNGAEEPELVQEKVGSCHGALIWKGRTNPVMNQSINRWIDSLGSDWCKRSQVKRCSTWTADATQKQQHAAPVWACQLSSLIKVVWLQLNVFTSAIDHIYLYTQYQLKVWKHLLNLIAFLSFSWQAVSR